MTSYLIAYVDASGETLGTLKTCQPSHWDACSFGWDNAPEGTEDFQVVTVSE